ncbi:hypothetical protein CBS115989_3200 [Aspergillus niger]|nr:hypothetical protein CBS133816_10620 [Aspergillus niger]KAI2821133.1 hypothetical protein CBS115989_3200 [Aspergillus niger]KAI2851290.1 hypothetical protein CBS11350_1194 [Aspergillus niger]KAI2858091.1 hypothetical protein CBS11232_2740 [Aspergillus niger]KAI2858767.1 hypothetical protein CBS12448_5966 [Aspergillus niger]
MIIGNRTFYKYRSRDRVSYQSPKETLNNPCSDVHLCIHVLRSVTATRQDNSNTQNNIEIANRASRRPKRSYRCMQLAIH